MLGLQNNFALAILEVFGHNTCWLCKICPAKQKVKSEKERGETVMVCYRCFIIWYTCAIL